MELNFYALERLKNGVRIIKKHKMLCLAILIANLMIVLLNVHLQKMISFLEIIPILVIMNIVLIYLVGCPFGGYKVRSNLKKSGLLNHDGETPVLIVKNKDEKNERITHYLFDSNNIPLSTFNDRKPEIETALNVVLGDMIEKNGKKYIEIIAVQAEGAIPDYIEWNEEMLPKRNSEIALGEGAIGTVINDFAVSPHMLIGGSTGSGKTVLVRNIVEQCIKKEWHVAIVDYKGVDYNSNIIRNAAKVCLNDIEVLCALDTAIKELNLRKEKLVDNCCSNIDEYNRLTGENLKRVVIVIDEAAELLDTTGADKERKEFIKEVTNSLSRIARIGRAFGIHLVIATQRPDANIIPGQIKNNIDCRICGRADNTLSIIILDNGSAADIPKSKIGRFIVSDGTVFQGYYLKKKEENI